MEDKKFNEVIYSIEAFLKDEDLRHDVLFANNIKSTFLTLDAPLQAEIISKLTTKNRANFIPFIVNDLNADIILHLEISILHDFIHIVGNKIFGTMLSLVSINSAVSVLQELSQDFTTKILDFVQYKNRIKIKYLLSYPLDSVGRNMSVDFLRISNTFNVKQAIEFIKKNVSFREQESKNTEIFVVDEKGKAVGNVSIFDLLKFQQSSSIIECIRPIKYIVNTYDNIFEVMEDFFEYNLRVVPVVDVNSEMVGVLELSNVSHLIKEEAEKDLFMSAGVFEAKHKSIFGNAKARFIWLFVNFLTASTAASIIRIFEPLLSSFITLAALMPIVASIGGNTGNQASAVIIRSIAIKDFSAKQIFQECATAFLNSVLFFFIAFIISFILYRNLLISLSFGLGIIININIGSFLGSLIPVFINKLKIDPAFCSSIFTTMVTDMMGFFSFLGIAYLLLK